MPKFVPIFARLGDSWDVPADLMNELDAFTCAMYGRPCTLSVDELRFLRMNELCAKDTDSRSTSRNVDIGTLPPCRKKRGHIANPDLPDASDGHGWTMCDGTLEPLWFDGDVLPQQLTDIVEESLTTSDDDSNSDDDVPDPTGTDYPDGDSSDSDFE